MKKIIEGLKELKKKPYGRAVIFFGCYLLFFIVLAILSRVATGSVSRYSDYEFDNDDGDTIDVSSIDSTNYKFLYTIKVDDNTYIYDGNKTGAVFDFTYNNENYTYKNNTYYKGNDIVDNPYKFGQFLQLDNITGLLKESYLDSKTSYEDGRIKYNYLLSTNTIDKYFNGIDSDYDEIPNNISISANSKDVTIDIELGLDSYCKINKLCNNMKITLEYSDFSK